MGVLNYYGIEGEIFGDSQSGDYLRDALGSVTGTISPSTGTVQNRYRYKPYGEQLVKTGTSPDPKFQWVGTAGYRHSAISHSASYVRARHFGQEEGTWTTVDPIWPREPSYTYVNCAITVTIDFTGLQGLDLPRPVIIGPPIPGQYCLPTSPPGSTVCQSNENVVGFGEVVTLICAQGLAFPCTVVHENVHRDQISACCAKLAKCIKGSKDNGVACRKKYENWVTRNNKAFECEAYKVSCDCFKAQEGQFGIIPGGGPQNACSVLTQVERKKDCDERDKRCAGNPKPTPCPF